VTGIPTIAEASRLLAARAVSPVELLDACLGRIARHEATLHAFVTPDFDLARAAARAAETRRMRGAALGPLDGIPIGHKDVFLTAGLRTTAQSRVLADHVPDVDASVVRRLREAGTVLMGKLTTYEFAMGGPDFGLPWPPARNPWGPNRMTAGSSSGTAAAVAAGFVLGGTGSDTGGSIRVPSAYCGIAGLKPTYGLVPRRGLLPLSVSLDHAGPMAWTAEDCALLLNAMAGHDPADPASARRAVPDFTAGLGRSLRGLKVGLVSHFHETDNPATPAVRGAIAGACDFFRGEGATVREVTLPSLQAFNAACHVILLVEACAVHRSGLEAAYHDYGALLRSRLLPGFLIAGTDYVQAQRCRRALTDAVRAAMAEVDILLTTAAPREAMPLAGDQTLRNLDLPPFTAPFNVTGQPAISVCAGFGEAGLPVSIQLAARPFEEPLLLAVADAYEKAHGWRAVRPALERKREALS
jgi:aspartyl-tRNA(Asn)/glutamyl-tRNA(Gln) amidotransferase subunit A